jgi:flagellar biosynthesis component FlhA
MGKFKAGIGFLDFLVCFFSFTFLETKKQKNKKTKKQKNKKTKKQKNKKTKKQKNKKICQNHNVPSFFVVYLFISLVC